MHSKTTPQAAAEQVLLREQRSASARWYRSGVVHPVTWLHPTLRSMSSAERDQLLGEARLQATGSPLFLFLMLLGLAVSVLAWYFVSATSRHAFGTTAVAIAVLGGGIAHGICYHRAIGEQLAMRQAQRAYMSPSEA